MPLSDPCSSSVDTITLAPITRIGNDGDQHGVQQGGVGPKLQREHHAHRHDHKEHCRNGRAGRQTQTQRERESDTRQDRKRSAQKSRARRRTLPLDTVSLISSLRLPLPPRAFGSDLRALLSRDAGDDGTWVMACFELSCFPPLFLFLLSPK